jgi:hypothetical protein
VAITVADLAAVLSLKTDKGSFAAGDALIEKIKTGAKRMFAFQTVERVASWFTQAIGGVVDLGDQLDEMSQKTGVSVEDLQEVGYAAKQSGMSQEELGSTLGKLGKNLYQASEGNKTLSKSFSTMGIAVKDAHGKVRPVTDVLGDMADHFSTLPDGPKKTALAMAVMGRAGANMIPVLNQGRSRLEELRQEFKDTGAEIDGPTAAAFGNLNDQKDLLATGWQGVKTQLATALLPTLLEIVKGFIAWFKANRTLIKQGIASVAKVLSVALKAVAYAVGLVLEGFTFLGEHWDTAKYAIYALVAALGVYEAATIAAGIASAISWLVGLWPIGLLLLAIGAVVFAVQDFYTYLNGGDSVFGRLVDAAKKYLGIDLTGVVGDTVDTVIFLFNTWWQSVKLIFGFVKTEFEIMKTLVLGIWRIIKPIVEAIESAAKTAADVASGFGMFDVENKMTLRNSGSNVRYQGPLGTANRIVDHATGGLAGAMAVRAAQRPAAGGGAGGGAAPQMHATVNIATGTGDPDEIGRHVVHHMTRMHDDWVRQLGWGGEE